MGSVAVTANGCTSARRPERVSAAQRTAASAGLMAVVGSALGLAVMAASDPSRYVPGRSGGWPHWLSGPLRGLEGASLSSGRFQALTLIMCAGYLVVLATAASLRTRTILAAVLAANAAIVLGPPLISQDVFGYLAFARLGVLHGLDPYSHFAADVPTDAAFPFVGWPFQHSPYGPLFTLGSYAVAPLGLAGGLWALKAIAAIASVAASALTGTAARRTGRSPGAAIAFVGLSPITIVLAVGGAHNDTLVAASLAAALALSAYPRGALAALVAGIGVKASAGLVLPFMLLAPGERRERLRLGAFALAALALLAAIAFVGFGSHAFGFVGALREQQQLIATHSVPAETARWAGLDGVPGWWRDLFLAGFLVALAAALWRTARGADWRTMAGWATLALLLSTAWLLPWYALWLLPLAAVSHSRRLRWATLAFCAYAVLIHLPLADPLLKP